VRTDLQPARDIFGSKAGRRQYLDMSRQICDLLSTNKGRELVADLHEFVGNLVGNRVCDQVLCDLDTGSVMESGLFCSHNRNATAVLVSSTHASRAEQTDVGKNQICGQQTIGT